MNEDAVAEGVISLEKYCIHSSLELVMAVADLTVGQDLGLVESGGGGVSVHSR